MPRQSLNTEEEVQMVTISFEKGRKENILTSHSLRMVRAEVDMKAFHIWAVSRQLVRPDTFDEGFAMHCLLTESFGHLAPKPFRLIATKGAGGLRAVLYGYGNCLAQELRDASSAFADPLQIKILQPSTINTKAMPEVWEPGKKLGFEVMVRPVVRHARGSNYAGKERDIYQVRASQQTMRELKIDREKAYSDWLSQQFRSREGAQIEECKLKSFQRVRVVRGLRGRAVEGPDAIMRGTLTVTSSTEFATLLGHGVGRHRAYGYGMLLLRPALNAR